MTLKVWDLTRLGPRVQKTLKTGNDTIYAVALTPDGRRAVSGSDGCDLKIWDIKSGRGLQILVAARIEALVVTADGRRAISGHWDNSLRVWNIEEAALREAGRRAIWAEPDASLWEIQSGLRLQTLTSDRAAEVRVWTVAATQDGRRAVSGSDDKTLRVWDLESGATIAAFSCEADPNSCAVANDGTIVVGDFGGRVHILTLEE